MFGADTPLVIDALQIVALAAAGGAAIVYLTLRRRRAPNAPPPSSTIPPLEERVRNLERIATDRSHDLADEIEALRADGQAKTRTEESA